MPALDLNSLPPDRPLRRRRRASKEAPRLPRNPVGRPTLLADPVRLENFLTALRAGNYRSVSAEFAGISPETVKDWVARGTGRGKRPGSAAHREFVRLVRQAEASAEVMVVGNLVARSRVDYNAAAYWLRTRAPDRWGPGADPSAEQPLAIDASKHETNVLIVSPELAAQLAEQLVAARRGDEVTVGPRVDRLAAFRVEGDDEDIGGDV